MALDVRRKMLLTVACLACVVASLALESCASSSESPRDTGPSTTARAAARTTTPQFVGYVWRLTHVTTASLSFDVKPNDANDPPRIQFTADGTYGASDGVNYMSGNFALTNSGFSAQSGASTSAGYAGTDRDVTAIIDGIGALVGPGLVTVTAAASNQVAMSVKGYELTFRRAGVAAMDTTYPSSTGSAPSIVYGTPPNCDQSTAPANVPCPGDSIGSS